MPAMSWADALPLLRQVVSFATTNSKELASSNGAQAQRGLVANAWSTLGQAYRAAGVDPTADASYQSVMARAYGALADWQGTLEVRDVPTQAGAVQGNAMFVANCASLYDGLHRDSPRPRDRHNTVLWVRAALTAAGTPQYKCLDTAAGGDCDLTGAFSSYASPTSGLERDASMGWPVGDWRWFAWRDPPFQPVVFAPPLVWSLDLAQQVASALIDIHSPRVITMPKQIPFLSPVTPQYTIVPPATPPSTTQPTYTVRSPPPATPPQAPPAPPAPPQATAPRSRADAVAAEAARNRAIVPQSQALLPALPQQTAIVPAPQPSLMQSIQTAVAAVPTWSWILGGVVLASAAAAVAVKMASRRPRKGKRTSSRMRRSSRATRRTA